MNAPVQEPRIVCMRCRRPAVVCYCASLPRLDTTTRVVILQHPREREMPIGTARMASLCLPHASLHVGVRWDAHPALLAALADPQRPSILLYPGPGARDILTDPPAGPVTLVVVDGTWSQAKVVVRDNPVLRELPRYAFTAPEPTQYRIRREPRVEYVSTIEALMHVLGALEGDPARFRALLDPLRAMVDAQLAYQGDAAQPRLRHKRGAGTGPRPLRARLPEALTSRFDDVVIIVGEANAWPYDGAAERPGDELVHWAAHRPGTGETFEMVAAPEQPLAPSTTFHTRLSEARLRAGVPRVELLAGFARFVRPTDVICSWGHFAPDLMRQSGGALPAERIDLRAIAQRLAQGKVGTLEAYAAAVAAPPAAHLADGRAGARLGLLVAMLGAWRALPG